tara:strand:- start:95 stop:1213 length:1119 start_codon:yes stop_codon:yes gene_type:complete
MMSELGLFCPSCGGTIDRERQRAAGREIVEWESSRQNVLCSECYFDQFELVKIPDKFLMQICSVCNAIHIKNRWNDIREGLEEEVIVGMIERKLEVHVDAGEIKWGFSLKEIDKKTKQIDCKFEGEVRGREIVETKKIEIEIIREICEICRKKSGGYYAGEIQIRSASRVPTEKEKNRAVEIANSIVAKRKEMGDRNDFISKIIEKKEGIDIRISTSKLGQKISRSIAEELGGSLSTSETLVTEDRDGNRIYRIAYLIRLPAVIIGDIIDIGDERGPILVNSVGEVLKGICISTGESYKGKINDKRLNIIQHISSANRTSIVSMDDEYSMQILDPETYHPITITRPTFIELGLKETKVIKTRDGVYVLPNDE